MARVRFTGAYTYVPSTARHTSIVYRAGRDCTVKRECADGAVAAGVAIELPQPARMTSKGVSDE